MGKDGLDRQGARAERVHSERWWDADILSGVDNCGLKLENTELSEVLVILNDLRGACCIREKILKNSKINVRTGEIEWSRTEGLNDFNEGRKLRKTA